MSLTFGCCADDRVYGTPAYARRWSLVDFDGGCTEKMLAAAARPGITGVLIDACRHPGPGGGYEAFAAGLPRGAQEITEKIAHMRQVLRQQYPNLALGLCVFAPSLAMLVGQDYAALSRQADFLAPMLYRFGAPGDQACINYELQALCSAVSTRLQIPEKLLIGFLLSGLGFSCEKGRGTDVYNEILPQTVAQQCRMAREQMEQSCRLVPFIWLADDHLAYTRELCLQSGCDDLMYFFAGLPGAEHYLQLLRGCSEK